MKRIVICVLLMSAMLLTGIILEIQTHAVTGELEGELKMLGSRTHSISPEEREITAKKLSEKWESFCADNIFLTNNEGAFEISESLVRIISYSVSDEKQFAEECRIAAQLIELYNESRALTLGNIF